MGGLTLLRWVVALSMVLWAWLPAGSGFGQEQLGETGTHDRRAWAELRQEAETLGLPTRFLQKIPPGFASIEFEDLRSFAAEYHPEQHRMVLNRVLSLNAAGGTLRPLSQLPHRDLATLYHELFHVYMDFAESAAEEGMADPRSEQLLTVARTLQHCRYGRVLITPLVRRKSFTEARLLTERESWEALNETWAVFVGWHIWTTLQLREHARSRGGSGFDPREEWLERLKKADQDATLSGYYEPEDPRERALTRKRHLAPSFRISPAEVRTLLELVLEASPESARRAGGVMEGSEGQRGESCEGLADPHPLNEAPPARP